jgi:hypothetical protein
LSRARKALATALVSGAMLATMVTPAMAINDSQVPADECSDNPTTVGEPGIVGLSQPQNPVGPATSANNPGESTGARGQANSAAVAHCD